MNTAPAYIDIDAIKSQYAPYDKMIEFSIGMGAYQNGCYEAPKGFSGVQQQAFDRGLEAAMKIRQAARWVEQNVGSN